MSSPRRILSPLKSNNRSSPVKTNSNSPTRSNSNSPFISNSSPFNAKLSPVSLKKGTTPSQRPKLAFTIFEDKTSNSSFSAPSLQPQTSNKLDHNDQENILQPKPINLKQNAHKRTPLQNLSINEYPGFIQMADGQRLSAPIQLSEVYMSKTYKPTSTNYFKINSLPNFVTPPRKQLMHNDKYLYKSSNDLMNLTGEDEMENRLLAKQKRLRKRSMSVGKNDRKLHLITKNKFQILST